MVKASAGSHRRRVSSTGRSTSARQAAIVDSSSRVPSSQGWPAAAPADGDRGPEVVEEDQDLDGDQQAPEVGIGHRLVERQQPDAGERHDVGELELGGQDHQRVAAAQPIKALLSPSCTIREL